MNGFLTVKRLIFPAFCAGAAGEKGRLAAFCPLFAPCLVLSAELALCPASPPVRLKRAVFLVFRSPPGFIFIRNSVNGAHWLTEVKCCKQCSRPVSGPLEKNRLSATSPVLALCGVLSAELPLGKGHFFGVSWANCPHFTMQHFLYFFPLPQGQGSLRPMRGPVLR